MIAAEPGAAATIRRTRAPAPGAPPAAGGGHDEFFCVRRSGTAAHLAAQHGNASVLLC